MTENEEEEEKEKTILNDINEYGCHVIHVFEEEEHPRFTYSVGIEQVSDQPELLVTGLPQELAHSIINDYSRRIKAGETFEPDSYYEGFLGGFDVTFKEVEKKHYTHYLGWAIWLYKGDDFKVLQLIYPNTSGVWPWDKEASEDLRRFIPKLYKTNLALVSD